MFNVSFFNLLICVLMLFLNSYIGVYTGWFIISSCTYHYSI